MDPTLTSNLAILPNGEAVRPEDVRACLIEPAPAPASLDGRRFRVVLVLATGERRVIGTGLARNDATDLSRRCARAVNEAAAAKPGA